MATYLTQLFPELASVPKQQGNSIDYCAFSCPYEELAFASDDGDEYKNDFASVMLKKASPNDTISFELYKAGTKVADLNDNTFGTYYPTFDQYPLQTGFVLEWSQVLNAFGGGLYDIRAQLDLLGEQSTFQSRCYRLMSFSDEAANDTARVKWTQDGKVQRSELDFTGLQFPFMIRVSGFILAQTPEIEANSYQDSNRQVKQVQDKITQNWSLEIKGVPYQVTKAIVENLALANSIVADDYNYLNHDLYRGLELIFDSFDEAKYFISRDRLAVYRIRLKDRFDNLIKSNN